jgi:hypothetical protein
MQRNVIFLTCLAVVLGVCGNAAAVDVPQGETKTLSGTVVDSNTLSSIAGTLIIDSGANVTIANRMIIDGTRDFESGVGAELIMNGESFFLPGDSDDDRLSMGLGDDAYLIINSGYFRIGTASSPGSAGDLKLADDPCPCGVHRIYLNGGTLRVHRMSIAGGDDLGQRNSHIFVGGGTLIVDDLSKGSPSEWEATINEDTGLPVLMAAEGYEGIIIADYNEGKIVTSTAGPQATEPDPERDDENLCPEVTLAWTAGPKTQATMGHDVYFGTDYNDVADATSVVQLGVYEGRQTATTFDPTGDLDLGAVYYWRVDQVNNSEAGSPFKGDVWSFTVNDGNAYGFDPEHDEIKVPLDKVLSWDPGCLATSHDVYFSTDEAEVESMAGAAFQINQTETSWDPCDFDFLQDYYWRIVEHSASETWIGPVLHFQAKSSIVDDNMILWYEFNETDGNSVADSSGYQFDSFVEGYTETTWDQTDSHDGGSISFDGEQGIEVPPEIAAMFATHEVSVSVWVKGARKYGETNWVFGAGGGMSNWPVEWNLAGAIPTSNGRDVLFLAGEHPTPDDDAAEFEEADSKDVLWWTAEEGASPEGWEPDWHHFVFVKNQNDDTMSIYFDGLLAEQRTDANADTLGTLRTRFSEFRIGSHRDNDNDYVGKMDDFRVYNKALSSEEVEALFRGGDLARAWGPDPFSGASDVPRDVVLGWRAGDFATHHDVYLGTDWDDVNDATTADGESKGRKLLGDESYDPPVDLEMGKTYYWRIDEVNEANEPDDLWKGNVWTFAVANFLIIDDFESYDATTNKIFDTWEDGNVNLTGSFIDLGARPFEPAHGGNQSMQLIYDNTIKWDWDHYWSEGGLPFASPQDFTEGGIKALTLYFYGDPDNDVNDTEQLYVALTGSLAEVRYTDDAGLDMNDLKLQEWTEWNIEVTDFIGVDPCAVTGLLIGFGDRDNTSEVGGEGALYVDDIRLYPPRCVPELGPEYDWSGNCIVDMADVGIMSDEWLRTDAQLSVAEPAVGPVAHWELDDSGSVATDSAGSNNGTLEGSVSWVTGKVGSGAAEFGSDDARIRVPHSAELMPATTVSVTAWIYPTQVLGYAARVVAKGLDTDNWEAYYMQFDGSASWAIRDPNHGNHGLGSSDLRLDEWTHVAGTYDGNESKIYIDGELDAEDSTGGMDLLQDSNDLSIGNRSDGNDRAFIGRIDDVRVYDYALNALEVAYVRDFAELMTVWLQEKLYPQ